MSPRREATSSPIMQSERLSRALTQLPSTFHHEFMRATSSNHVPATITGALFRPGFGLGRKIKIWRDGNDSRQLQFFDLAHTASVHSSGGIAGLRRGDDHIGAQHAKFARQFVRGVQIEIEQCRANGRAAGHGNQGQHKPPAARIEQSPKNTPKHLFGFAAQVAGARLGGAYSPRRTGAGSNCTTFLNEIRLPAVATAAARPKQPEAE